MYYTLESNFGGTWSIAARNSKNDLLISDVFTAETIAECEAWANGERIIIRKEMNNE